MSRSAVICSAPVSSTATGSSIFPVITGATGTDRIFDGYPDVRLELVESRLFDGRLQLLEYVPTPLDGPPDLAGHG